MAPVATKRFLPAGWFLLLLGAAFLVPSQLLLGNYQAADEAVQPELTTVLPPPVAAGLAGGDRYLAANLAIVKGMVVATELNTAREKALFARLLQSGMTLNPASEDGYYLAQAHLPWNGWVKLNQRIQSAATSARPWDWLPPFFRGFNTYFFQAKPLEAAPDIREAASRATPEKRTALEAMAARWAALGRDPGEAVKVLEAMLSGTQKGKLRNVLEARIRQMENLARLRRSAEAYRAKHDTPPDRLDDLTGYASLDSIPKDPFGDGFALNPQGQVVVSRPAPVQKQWHGSGFDPERGNSVE